MAALSLLPSLPLPSPPPSSSSFPKPTHHTNLSRSPSLASAQLHARALRHATTTSFNHAIRAYTSILLHPPSLHLYLSMFQFDLVPNEYTFPFVIKSCVSLNLLSLGRQIHASVVKLGLFSSNIFCACAILDLYAKLVSLDDALLVFDRIPKRSSIAWNPMIKAYAQNGYLEKGLELIEDMTSQGLQPEISTWNSLISSCVNCREINLALEILREMVSKGGAKPNPATFNTLLVIISAISSGDTIKELHGFVLRNRELTGLGPVDSDRVISALASGYAHNKLVEYGYSLFLQVRLKINLLFNSIIEAFLDSGQVNRALDVFREMTFQFAYEGRRRVHNFSLTLILPECARISKRGLDQIHAYAYRNNLENDTSVCNALISMYAKRGDITSAERIFQRNFEKDRVSWNTIIFNYTSIFDFHTAFKLFDEMTSHGIRPDEYTFSCLLNCCSFCSYLKQGMAFHAQILKRGFYDSDRAVQNALMDTYGNCGCMQDAQNVFDEIGLKKDIISWNTIISSYGFSTNPSKSLSLFHTMQGRGYRPNRITFTALLTACSHAGLVKEALYYFESMSLNYGITPDLGHYCCVVDCLARVGELNKALEFINNMPIEPDKYIWSALLNGSWIHGHLELAEIITKRLLDLDPYHSGYWVLLSNAYADASRWSDKIRVRVEMEETGVKKLPGFSWIETSNTGELNSFFNGDKRHARCDEIYSVLDDLMEQLRDEGYVPVLDLDL